MKPLTIIILLLILGIGAVDAQYKINKTKYDYKTWTHEEGDPYDPAFCGILSVIPGVGQMVAHEFGRGAAFFGGAAGCFFLFGSGFAVAWDYNEPLGITMMLLGLSGFLAVDIWSIVDASRVAKVNNLAYRNRDQTGMKLRLEPCISPVQTCGSTKTQVGLSLKFVF